MSASLSGPSSLSIGEAIKCLREEFPDVSISKIRFLEAEGLVEPERTPSGYRKFNDDHLARLRYVLRLQRDHFMPLKVIRKRLEHFDPSGLEDGDAEGRPPPAGGFGDEADEAERIEVGLHLSFKELASASGLEPDKVRELADYGLIDAHPLDGGAIYDEDDLMVAAIARDFRKFGVEPRHLKMYRHFADRETALFEQILLPRQGGGNGRRQVTQSASELSRLSKRLRDLLLRVGLRRQLLP
ncbi:MAG: transcriptional regulator FtsR [Candidatus Methylomirabilales bacterium]